MLSVINDRRICVSRGVGDSPHLHRAKIRLTLAMRTMWRPAKLLVLLASKLLELTFTGLIWEIATR